MIGNTGYRKRRSESLDDIVNHMKKTRQRRSKYLISNVISVVNPRAWMDLF